MKSTLRVANVLLNREEITRAVNEEFSNSRDMLIYLRNIIIGSTNKRDKSFINMFQKQALLPCVEECRETSI